MMKMGLVLTLFLSLNSHAGGKLLSASSSSEQDILRLELNFDRLIDSSAIEVQYSNKSMSLTLPDVAFKKAAPLLEAKSSFTKGLKIKSSNEKNITLEIEFNDITALQMKENLAVESLGKTLIIEILPPNIQSANATTKDSTLASDLASSLPGKLAEKGDASTNTKEKSTDDSATATASATTAVTDESQIPLFEKKAEHKTEDSGVTKIVFMVLGLIALGGYLIWFLKNKTKMVNGPESLMKIKMVTQFHIGPKKSLAVIRVAGESLLLAITDTQISLIKSLALLDEDLPEMTPIDFAQSLEEEEERPTQRSSSKSSREFTVDALNTEEEFSFGPAVKTSLTKNSLTNKIPMLRKII